MPQPESYQITHNALDPALAIRAGRQVLELFEDPATPRPSRKEVGLLWQCLFMRGTDTIELPYGVDTEKYSDLLTVAQTAFALRAVPTRKIVTLHVLEPGGYFSPHRDNVDQTVDIWSLLNDALMSFRPFSLFPYVNAQKIVPGDRVQIFNKPGRRPPHSVKNISFGRRVSLTA